MALLTSVAAGGSVSPSFGKIGCTRISKTVNFADALGAGGVAGAVGMSAADVLPVINVPAGAYVRCAVKVVTPSTDSSTRTIDVGDGTDPDGFVDGGDMKTAGRYIVAPALVEAAPNTIVGYSFGKYYSAADTIDLTAVQALTNGIVRVDALIFDLNCD
jgi:hypothetical protein